MKNIFKKGLLTLVTLASMAISAEAEQPNYLNYYRDLISSRNVPESRKLTYLLTKNTFDGDLNFKNVSHLVDRINDVKHLAPDRFYGDKDGVSELDEIEIMKGQMKKGICFFDELNGDLPAIVAFENILNYGKSQGRSFSEIEDKVIKEVENFAESISTEEDYRKRMADALMYLKSVEPYIADVHFGNFDGETQDRETKNMKKDSDSLGLYALNMLFEEYLCGK